MCLYHNITGTGSVVVLIHGFMADHSYWANLGPSLAHDHTVITIDLLGFGRSPKPKDIEAYTVEKQAEAVYACLETLEATKDITLVGHSMGAIVAAEIATTWPDSVTKLILSNMPIFTDISEVKHELSSTGRLYRTLLYRPYGRLFWPAIKQALPLLRIGNADIRNMAKQHTHASRQGSLSVIEHSNAPRILQALTVPTELIVATADRPIYIRNLSNISLPENITVTIAKTRHHTPLEHPAYLLELIA